PDVVEGIIEAVARAEAGYKGLVIWQPKPPFSAGANLNGVMALAEKADFTGLEGFIARFQQIRGVEVRAGADGGRRQRHSGGRRVRDRDALFTCRRSARILHRVSRGRRRARP